MSVLAFPLHRRRDLVLEVVQGLSIYHQEQANMFWRQMAKSLVTQLTDSGIHLEDAKEEVRNLLYAALDAMQQVTLGASSF